MKLKTLLTLILNSKKIYKAQKLGKPSISKISESIAKTIVKKTYVPHNIITEQNRVRDVLPIIINQTKVKRINIYDVNSLYPFSLINKYPIKNNRKKSSCNLKEKKVHPYSLDTMTNYILHIYKKKYTHKYTKVLLNSYYGNRHKYTPTITSLMLKYANVYMDKFKAIPDNPCCYSDTDSVFLRHPILEYPSKNIGHMKLEIINSIKIHKPRNYQFLTNNRKNVFYKGHTHTPNLPRKTPKDFISIIKFIYNKHNYK